MFTLTDDGAAALEVDPTICIDLRSPESIARWSRKLCCTESELRDAARKVGPDIEDMQHYLLTRTYLESIRRHVVRH